jgi:uncharacterized protein involved in exopolysaccharide biosynthesis
MTLVNQENFPIMSYLKIFFRRKEFLFIPCFIGLIMGICFGLILPKQYRSNTVIMVQEGKTDNPLFDKLAVSTTVMQRLVTIREAMLGWNSLVKLVKRLDMDKDVKTTKEFEDLIEKIRDNIDIRLKSDNVIDLSYVDFDPVRTQAVVQTVTDIFIERNQEIMDKETADAIAFIEEQLHVYKGKIKSAEIAKMQEQLNELLVDSTDKHPMVRELREKINSKKEELRKENLQYTDSEAIKVQSNDELISSIKTALDKIDSKDQAVNPKAGSTPDVITKVMLIDKLDDVLARDAQVNENIYNMLLQRLETAKITQRLQASKEGTKYNIIDPPRIPLRAFKPNRVLIALTGLILGGVFGFGLVVAGEFLDKSFIDVEEAKEFLGVPLLGAISKINTDETLRQEHDRMRWIYSLTVVAGFVMVILTVAMKNFIK